jgi:hypothetical protein
MIVPSSFVVIFPSPFLSKSLKASSNLYPFRWLQNRLVSCSFLTFQGGLPAVRCPRTDGICTSPNTSTHTKSAGVNSYLSLVGPMQNSLQRRMPCIRREATFVSCFLIPCFIVTALCLVMPVPLRVPFSVSSNENRTSKGTQYSVLARTSLPEDDATKGHLVHLHPGQCAHETCNQTLQPPKVHLSPQCYLL